MNPVFRLYRDAYADLPRSAWLLAVIELINRSGSMVLFFLTLYTTQKLGFNLLQAGRTLSAFGAGALFGSLLGGWLSDRLGPNRVQQLSLVLSGLMMLALSFSHNFSHFFVLMAIWGLCSNMLYPANQTAMSLVCGHEIRAKGFALNRLATNLGVTIGPVIGGYLALHNYSMLFYVDAVTCFAAAIMISIFLPGLRASVQKKQSVVNSGRKSPWRDYHFLFLLLCIIFVGCIFMQILSTFSLYCKEYYHLAENHIGQLMAVNTSMIVISEMVLLHLLRKQRPYRVVAMAMLFLGGGFALMPLGSGFFFGALTVFIWTFGEMLSLPLLTNIISQRACDQNRGQYLGMYSLAFSLAFVFAPALGTWVYDRFGPTHLWTGIGILGLFMSLFVLLLERSAKPDEPDGVGS